MTQDIYRIKTGEEMPRTIRRPDDFHVHLRTGAVLKAVLPFTSNVFARALVMPNTIPPILTPSDVMNYKELIQLHQPGFEPLMTFKLTDQTKVEDIWPLYEAGAIAAKLYPVGATTNSQDGVSIKGHQTLKPVFEKMSEVGMALCIHAEDMRATSFMREEEYLKNFALPLVRAHPELKIVIEHISTEFGIEWIKNITKVFDTKLGATITLHHMMLTIDDVIGSSLNPHNFCKPICKTEQDRKALIKAATSGDPHFFFGSDSAPHLISKKECDSGAAGIFSAPVALQMLADIFDDYKALDKLEDFTSTFGANFYGLPLNTETITLLNKPSWGTGKVKVPLGGGQFDEIDPFMGNAELNWSIEEISDYNHDRDCNSTADDCNLCAQEQGKL